MARENNRSMGNMFQKFNDNTEENKKEGGNVNVQDTEKNKQVQTEEHTKQNEKEVQANTQGTDNEVVEEANQSNLDKLDVSINELKGVIDERKKRKTMEETHARVTFLVDRELLKRLDKLANKAPRGFKTIFINKAIETMLNELEK